MGYSFFDADQDGDVDGFGVQGHRSRAWTAPDDGRIRQYGDGKPGAGGALPVLGATGPVRIGEPIGELRLRNAVGGTHAILALGLSEADLPGVPFPGMSLYVDQPILLSLPVPGAPGAVGAGEWTLPLAIPPALVGVSLFLQVFPSDPGAQFHLSATNGLEIRLGQ